MGEIADSRREEARAALRRLQARAALQRLQAKATAQPEPAPMPEPAQAQSPFPLPHVYESELDGADAGPIGLGERLRDKDWMSWFPVLGGLNQAQKQVGVWTAAKYLEAKRNGDETAAARYAMGRNEYEMREAVDQFLMTVGEEQERGTTTAAKIGEGVVDMVPFAAEIYLTAGLSGAVKKGVREAGERLVAKATQRAGLKAVGNVAARTAGWAAQGAARAGTGMGHRVVAGATENMLEGLSLTPEGEAVFTNSPGPATALLKAFGSVTIEAMSEEAGKPLASGAKAVAGWVGTKVPIAGAAGKKMVDVLRAAWNKMPAKSRAASETLQSALQRVGYNGVLEEIGEERLGDAMRVVLGVEDFGLRGKPEYEDAGAMGRMVQRAVAAIPSGNQMLVEAGIFAVPMAGRGGVMLAAGLTVDRAKAQAAAQLPANPSRSQVAEVLGVKPTELPAEVQSATQRQQFVADAQAYLRQQLTGEQQQPGTYESDPSLIRARGEVHPATLGAMVEEMRQAAAEMVRTFDADDASAEGNLDRRRNAVGALAERVAAAEAMRADVRDKYGDTALLELDRALEQAHGGGGLTLIHNLANALPGLYSDAEHRAQAGVPTRPDVAERARQAEQGHRDTMAFLENWRRQGEQVPEEPEYRPPRGATAREQQPAPPPTAPQGSQAAPPSRRAYLEGLSRDEWQAVRQYWGVDITLPRQQQIEQVLRQPAGDAANVGRLYTYNPKGPNRNSGSGLVDGVQAGGKIVGVTPDGRYEVQDHSGRSMTVPVAAVDIIAAPWQDAAAPEEPEYRPPTPLSERAGDERVEQQMRQTAVRRDQPGVAGGVEKPQGLYLNRKGQTTGVEPEMTEERRYDWHPRKPLVLKGELIAEHQRFGTGKRGSVAAGIMALRRLVGKSEFDRLMRIRHSDELLPELRAKYPQVAWDRYFDAYEMLEAYAGLLARDRGYDAIVTDDELVALSDTAITQQTGTAPPRYAPEEPDYTPPTPADQRAGDERVEQQTAAAQPEMGLTAKEQAELTSLQAIKDDRTKDITAAQLARLDRLEAKAHDAFAAQERAAAADAYSKALGRVRQGSWRSRQSVSQYGKAAGLDARRVVSDLREAGASDDDIRSELKYEFGAEATDAALASNAPPPTSPDYASMSWDELKAAAKARGIGNKGGKKGLIAALEKADTEQQGGAQQPPKEPPKAPPSYANEEPDDLSGDMGERAGDERVDQQVPPRPPQYANEEPEYQAPADLDQLAGDEHIEAVFNQPRPPAGEEATGEAAQPTIEERLNRDAADVLESGFTTYKAWRAEILRRHGDGLKGRLAGLWREMAEVRQAIREVAKELGGGTVPASKVKPLINARIAWYKGKPRLITAQALLNASLRYEAKGANKGYRAGQLDLQADHTQMMEFAKANLPPALVARIAPVVARSRTPAEQRHVIEAINNFVRAHERRAALADFDDAVAKAGIRYMRPEYKERMRQILDWLVRHEPRDETVRRAESRMRHAATDSLGDIPGQILSRAQRVLRAVTSASTDGEVNARLQKMPPGNIRAIADAIRVVAHNNRLKQEIQGRRRIRTQKQINAQAAAEVKEMHGEKYDVGPGERMTSKVTRKAHSAWRWLWRNSVKSTKTKVAGLAKMGGAVWDTLYAGPRRAAQKEARLRLEARERMAAAAKEAGLTDEEMIMGSEHLARGTVLEDRVKRHEYTLPEARDHRGRRVEALSLTDGEFVSVLMHIKTAPNRAELLRNKGEGITIEGDRRTGRIKLTAADLRALLSQETDTHRKCQKVGVPQVQRHNKDTTNEASMERYGVEFAQVPDYWPRMRDVEAVQEGKMPEETYRQPDIPVDNVPYLKQRSHQSNAPLVITDFWKTVEDHTRATIAFAAWGDASEKAFRLLRDRSFRDQVRKALPDGDAVLRSIEEDIRLLQSVPDTQVEAERLLGRLITALQRTWSTAAVTLRLPIMALQTTSYMAAQHDIPAKVLYSRDVLIGSKELGSDAQCAEEMRRYMPDVYESTDAHNILERMLPGTGRGGAWHLVPRPARGGLLALRRGAASHPLRYLFAALGEAGDLGMTPNSWMDRKTAIRFFRAAKKMAMQEGLAGEEMLRTAGERAAEVSHDYIGTPDPLTMSAVVKAGKHNPFFRMLLRTAFTNQVTKYGNVVARAFGEAVRNPTARNVGRAASAALFVMVLPTLIERASKDAWKNLWGGGDDEETWLNWSAKLLTNIEGYFGPVGQVAGQSTEALVRRGQGRPMWAESIGETPLGAVMSTGLQTGGYAIDLVRATISEDDKDKFYQSGDRQGESKARIAFYRLMEQTIRVVSYGTGAPGPAMLEITKSKWPQHRKNDTDMINPDELLQLYLSLMSPEEKE